MVVSRGGEGGGWRGLAILDFSQKYNYAGKTHGVNLAAHV